MRPLLVLLALLIAAPTLAPPAASSDGSLGLTDGSGSPAVSHLTYTGLVWGPGWVHMCSGPCLVAPPADDSCRPGECDARTLHVHVPANHWATHRGGLRALVYNADESPKTIAAPRIRDAAGNLLSEGTPGASSVAWVPSVADGAYRIEVKGVSGQAPYTLHVFFESEAAQVGDRLPDLVTRPPTGLTLAPCRPEEDEANSTRCLRFDNRVGNEGPGVLEVRMGLAEGAKGLAGLGAWTQRIERHEGGDRLQPVGTAYFHVNHLHYHYEGVARYALHAYDLDTATRGAMVTESRKAGFCLLDSGVLDPARPGTHDPRYSLYNCVAPLGAGEFYMGVGAGWYDLYTAATPEQYVDVQGVPDGVYELVTTVNPDGTLLEDDATNNAASVLLRLEGSTVTDLGPP